MSAPYSRGYPLCGYPRIFSNSFQVLLNLIYVVVNTYPCGWSTTLTLVDGLQD
ncbi:transmembrane protein, putative [Medicago truncatula]|uniref:Transmembrane protein, putative n=1 Tax=Medicago truncatula TaxID=3880 RepID=A0A072TMM0_MEDTR|nr:transmembrane protein, putative [Medicago truncatula]